MNVILLPSDEFLLCCWLVSISFMYHLYCQLTGFFIWWNVPGVLCECKVMNLEESCEKNCSKGNLGVDPVNAFCDENSNLIVSDCIEKDDVSDGNNWQGNDGCNFYPPPGKNFYLNRLEFMNQDLSGGDKSISLNELINPIESVTGMFIATFTSDIQWWVCLIFPNVLFSYDDVLILIIFSMHFTPDMCFSLCLHTCLIFCWQPAMCTLINIILMDIFNSISRVALEVVLFTFPNCIVFLGSCHIARFLYIFLLQSLVRIPRDAGVQSQMKEYLCVTKIILTRIILTLTYVILHWLNKNNYDMIISGCTCQRSSCFCQSRDLESRRSFEVCKHTYSEHFSLLTLVFIYASL